MINKVFLSIVIPAYNAQNSIGKLLTSLNASKGVDFSEVEVIVVDDCSKDETVKTVMDRIAGLRHPEPKIHLGEGSLKIDGNNKRDSSPRQAGFRMTKKQFFHCFIIKLRKNSGPAKARNIGVKYTKGKVVLFLDADVVLHKNTLYEVIRSFKNDIDLFALTGVWDKKQNSRNFFPKFKALRDWSYWINERDPKNYYYLFSTRIAAIDRELFMRLGGFDTTYKAALVEDMELTYRITHRHAVVFNPKVMVHHDFEDFIPIARKYFWRSFYWSKIYRMRKKFDPVATTGKEAVTTVSAGLLLGFCILYFVFSIYKFPVVNLINIHFYTKYYIQNTIYIVLIIHFWGVRKFLFFAAKEEGVWFAVKSFFTGLVLYWVILAGAVASYVI